MNPLPPQAYTKDMLLTAYTWLQNQSEAIKELATTPDILISLYMKAKMNGEAALERPSIQNFRSELKDIANMMGDFEDYPPAPASVPISVHSPVAKVLNNHSDLDKKSLSLIQEIKSEFNLSSDQETLRLMISAGYKSLKNIK